MKGPRFFLVLLALKLYVLACLAALCPPLPLPEHGDFVKISQTKVNLKCHDSYEYENPLYPGREMSIINCKKGKWDDPQPECFRKLEHCLPPSEITNGVLDARPPYTANTMVRYYCNPGFELLGTNELVCKTPHYEWSDHPPMCEEFDPLVKMAENMNQHLIDKTKSFDAGRRIEKDVEFHGLDLFIAFDKSSSINPKQFQKGIEFAKVLVKQFNVSNDDANKIGGTRLAIYTFGDVQKEELTLDNKTISTTKKALDKLDSIKCVNVCDGGTNMAAALSRITFRVKTTRKAAKKVLFITSDGRPTTTDTNLKPVLHYTQELKKTYNFEIYTVGIGQDVDENLLEEMSSEPVYEHMFLLKEFTDFSKIMDVIQNGTAEPPPPPPEKCGYIAKENYAKRKLTNGKIGLGSWPWLAGIIVNDPNVTYGTKFACSGVLISSNWVLTSAQCVTQAKGEAYPPEDVFIVLGDEHLGKDNGNEQQFYAKTVIRHENFVDGINRTRKRIVDDLALIELNENATLNDFVRTACVLKTRDDHISAPGKKGFMIGWLMSSIEEVRRILDPVKVFEAKQVELEIIGCDDCIGQDMFKAFAKENPSEEECTDVDNGSPLIMHSSKKEASVVGIATKLEGCTLDTKSGYFYRVSYYYDWIVTETKNALRRHA